METPQNPISPDETRKKFEALLSKPAKDPEALEEWIGEWESLGSEVQDVYSRAHVASTINTADPEAERQLMHLVENILPLSEKYGFELSRKLVANPAVSKLPPYYDCFMRAIKSDIELYREENLPLKTEERKQVNEFEKIMGSMSPKFRGQDLTMQQVARFLEDPDRSTRKEAFEARAGEKRRNREKLEGLYDAMLKTRGQTARNAGFSNFRDYQFANYHRFDYTPGDCFDFHEAIAENMVPLTSKFHKERLRKLGTPSLAPYDTLVDPDSKTAIQPFKEIPELTSGCEKIFDRIDPELAGFFRVMRDKSLLDLGSRKGKAPGGYCTHFAKDHVPFIFMNAVGTRRDVETLLHESGHAFHYFLSTHHRLPTYHHTGLEFAEVASMSMELLSRPFLSQFYDRGRLEGILADQLKKIVEFFPFMAMIDAFQHWVYTSKDGANASARAKHWTELEKTYQPSLDWSGFEDIRDMGWQYPHVFSVPFYYVEYGIAQLGALAVWRQSLADYQGAVTLYKNGLKLGGSVPLPEMFKAVGAEFGMSSRIIQPLMRTIEAAL